MTNYAQHFSTLRTPQSQQADPRQVPNSAGGYSFALDKWKALDRWLILGADGGSYYATERELTIDNAKTIQACLAEDGVRAVARIAEISEAGRAPKNDPAIFALAMASGSADKATRMAALTALPQVCRIGTHLFHFARAAKAFRGWGRGLRAAVARWYTSKTPEQIEYQVAKYGQRDGWSHRDLLRLAHPHGNDPSSRYIVAGKDGLGERFVKRENGGDQSYDGVGELSEFLAAFEELKATRNENAAVGLILKHGFTHEMVPSELKNSKAVWAALLQNMPMTALIRNLAKMTAVGVLAPLGLGANDAANKITDAAALKKARVHPIALLSALRVYQQGHGEKGSLTWSPVPQIVDALDAAFYMAFDAIEPTGKRTLLAIDVSGSMDSGTIAGVPGITPRVAAAAMAMVTARAEQNWHIVGFASGGHGYGGRWGGAPSRVVDIKISPRQRLDDVIRTMQAVPMGGTDCALPMIWAKEQAIPVDVFHVYTDDETWFGSVHPHQALAEYRKQFGPAKSAVVGMVANDFTIADPSDLGQLDVVGFDTAAPNLLAQFARG